MPPRKSLEHLKKLGNLALDPDIFINLFEVVFDPKVTFPALYPLRIPSDQLAQGFDILKVPW